MFFVTLNGGHRIVCRFIMVNSLGIRVWGGSETYKAPCPCATCCCCHFVTTTLR